MDISDKIIIITKTGSGFGRALSAGLVKLNASVVGLRRHKSTLLETESLIHLLHILAG